MINIEYTHIYSNTSFITFTLFKIQITVNQDIDTFTSCWPEGVVAVMNNKPPDRGVALIHNSM